MTDQLTSEDLARLEERQLEIKEHRAMMASREQAEFARLIALQSNENVLKKSSRVVQNAVRAIFNPSVPMSKRARFIDMSHWNTLIDLPTLNNQVDGYILKFGGMDMGNGAGAKKVYEDAKWAERVNLIYQQSPRKRLEGYFFCDPDYHLLKMRDLGFVQNQDYKTNEVLIQIISSLHNGSWTWDNLRPDRLWKPVEAVWMDMEESDAWNGNLTAQWQEATVHALLDPLHQLQLAEKIPSDWKLGMYTRPLWLKDYKDVETYLWNRRDWIYLWFAQWIWPLDPDIQLTGLDELWAKYLPADTFKFLYNPYQLENRIYHHQFTGETFDVLKLYTPEVDANLFFDTVQAYDKLTGFTGAEVPPEPPIPPIPEDPDLKALTDRVIAVEAEVAKLKEKNVKVHDALE